MDVEELSDTWMSAKRAWDLARRQQRRRHAAAEPLTDAEASALQRAQADFQAAERRWDQAYRAGITIVTDEREDGALAGLYQRVVAAPLDDTPRLAYAEAVQDADPERTEFIWMQIEQRRLRRDRVNEERQQELSLRTFYLRSDRSAEWAREVRTLVAGYQFFRGFVEAVWLDAATFLARAAELYERAPVLQLYLSGAAPVAEQLFASPYLRRIRGLSLLRCELGDAEAGLIAELALPVRAGMARSRPQSRRRRGRDRPGRLGGPAPARLRRAAGQRHRRPDAPARRRVRRRLGVRRRAAGPVRPPRVAERPLAGRLAARPRPGSPRRPGPAPALTRPRGGPAKWAGQIGPAMSKPLRSWLSSGLAAQYGRPISRRGRNNWQFW